MSKKTKTIAEKQQSKAFWPVAIILGLVSLASFSMSAPVMAGVATEVGMPWPLLIPFILDGGIMSYGMSHVYAETVGQKELAGHSMLYVLFLTVVSLSLATYHAVTHNLGATTGHIVVAILIHVMPIVVLAMSIKALSLMSRPPVKVTRHAKGATRQGDTTGRAKVTRQFDGTNASRPKSARQDTTRQDKAMSTRQVTRHVKVQASAGKARMTHDKIKILMSCIRDGDTQTVMSHKTGVSVKTCQRTLKALASKGDIKRDATGRKWLIAEKETV